MDSIALAHATHVALGEQAVGEQGEKYKFGQSQKLVPREHKPGTPILLVSKVMTCPIAQPDITYLRSIAIVSSAPTSIFAHAVSIL
jgi:hypothetical protein